MARLKPRVRYRAGWSGKGMAALGFLVLALWLTGVVLKAWTGDEAVLLEPWQMQLRHAAVVSHGIGTWVFCFLAGRWVWHHVQLVWSWPRTLTWWFGLASAAIAMVGATSGLLLLYGPGESHEAVVSMHWWLTFGWPVLLGVHARALARRIWRKPNESLTHGR